MSFQTQADVKFDLQCCFHSQALIVNVKGRNKAGEFMVTLDVADCALDVRIVFFASPEVVQKSTRSAQNKHNRCSKRAPKVLKFYQLSRKSKPVLGISSGFPLLLVATFESPVSLKTVCESAATKMFSIEAEILVVGARAGGAGGGTLALVVGGCFGAGT